MDREEAQTILNAKLDEYRQLTYDQFAARVGDEEFPEVVGASGAQYQIEIQIVWDDKPGGAVRVLGSTDDGGWRAFLPLCDSLLVTPDQEGCD